jgi:hypothetical protein
MKSLCPFAAVAVALTLTLTLTSSAGPGSGKDLAACGRYVEARTASVFAGACHYNGEFTTRGRSAVLAWSFEEGSWQGESLVGVRIAAAVAGRENLAQADSETGVRRSVIYLADDVPLERAQAALALIRQRHASALGVVIAVERVPLTLAFRGDQYDLAIPEVLELRGEVMPDRACCKMPLNVWYDPFVTLDRRLVGCSELFVVHAPVTRHTGGARFTSYGANDAFTGRFALPLRRTVTRGE